MHKAVPTRKLPTLPTTILTDGVCPQRLTIFISFRIFRIGSNNGTFFICRGQDSDCPFHFRSCAKLTSMPSTLSVTKTGDGRTLSSEVRCSCNTLKVFQRGHHLRLHSHLRYHAPGSHTFASPSTYFSDSFSALAMVVSHVTSNPRPFMFRTSDTTTRATIGSLARTGCRNSSRWLR